MMCGRRDRSSRSELYVDDRLVGAATWVLGDPAKLLMRIPDKLLDLPVFVAVDRGGGSFALAGTGFVLGLRGPPAHLYVITARHCVEQAERYGGLYVRFNNYAGGSDLVRLDGAWYFPDHDADDVAVMPLPHDFIDTFEVWPIDVSVWAATDEFLEAERVGVGDELLVLGLFTRRGGNHRNRPIVRAGIIAAMPDEPLVDLNSGLEYDAYLAEVRSIGGLSGSPVFVVLPPGRVNESGEFETDRRLFSLLGLVRGHWDKRTEEFADFEESEADQLNTGIAIVTPVQKAIDVIMTTEALVKDRKDFEKRWARLRAPTEDSADRPTPEEEFGRFKSLTRKLVSVPKKELDEKREGES